MSFSDGFMSGLSSGFSDFSMGNVGSIMGQSFGAEARRIAAQTGPQAFRQFSNFGRWFLRKTIFRGRAKRDAKIARLAQKYIESAANVAAKNNAPYIFQMALFMVQRLDQKLSSDPQGITPKQAVVSLEKSIQRLSNFDRQLQASREAQTNAFTASIVQPYVASSLGQFR